MKNLPSGPNRLNAHATIRLGDDVVPLIGVPPAATREECDVCHTEFSLQDVELWGTRFLCRKDRVREQMRACADGGGGSGSKKVCGENKMRVIPGQKIFDVEQFKKLNQRWIDAAHDTDALMEVFDERAELNKGAIEYYEKMKTEVAEFPHRVKAVEFWISCLKSGLYPQRPMDGDSEFNVWARANAPYVDFDLVTVPNLEKLNG